MKRTLLDIGKAGVAAVSPGRLLHRMVTKVPGGVRIAGELLRLPPRGRLLMVGAGKAVGEMAALLEKRLGERIARGVVVVKEEATAPCRRVRVLTAGHPIPDRRSLVGARAIRAVLADLSPDDLVLALISGGASSLLELPVDGISLGDLRLLTRLLLRSGAPIGVLNAVRRALSRVKGGGLARWAFPARVRGLILSDVIGSPLDLIGSGPTIPPFLQGGEEDLRDLLGRWGVWGSLPARIREAILRLPSRPAPRAPGDVRNHLIGDLRLATRGACDAARRAGFRTLLLTSALEGEAREVAKVLAGIARSIREDGRPIKPPAVVVAGGELTVTVRGNGLGGRCQELALGFALAVGEGRVPGAALLALGTDGTDGPCDAAGAYADHTTLRRARRRSLDPRVFLARNDSYHFFDPLGDLIRLGPTGTNVGDLYLLVVT